MIYYDFLETVSKVQYERLCDELSEVEETNKELEMENVAIKLENERLREKIDNFNKALDGMREVK